MKKFFKALVNIFACLFGIGCEWKREATDGGALDFSGQGKSKYGE